MIGSIRLWGSEAGLPISSMRGSPSCAMGAVVECNALLLQRCRCGTLARTSYDFVEFEDVIFNHMVPQLTLWLQP